MNKKAITPVVATSLLLVVTVFAIISFQTWFQTYESGLNTKVEIGSSQSISGTQIENVIGSDLYFKNGYKENLTLKSVFVNGVNCNISVNVSNGIKTIPLGDCYFNMKVPVSEIVVVTDKKVFQKKIYVPEIHWPVPVLNISVNATSVNYGASVLLNWSSKYASSCVASGSWSGSKLVSGSEVVGPLSAPSTFILTCSDSTGQQVVKSVYVNVTINYAMWNSLDIDTSYSLPNSNNLTINKTTGGVWGLARATAAVSSGKWYWENTVDVDADGGGLFLFGVANSSATLTSYVGGESSSYSYYGYNGVKINTAVQTVYGATFTAGDVISVALDMNTGDIWWAKNGVWQNGSDPATGLNPAFTGLTGAFYPASGTFTAGSNFTTNFGQSAFVYPVPTGFNAGVWN